MLHVKNPHSVLAALKSRPQDVLEIRLSSVRESKDFKSVSEEGGDPWSQVVALARKSGIPVASAPKSSRGEGRSHFPRNSDPRSSGDLRADDGRTSVTEALLREKPPISLEELLPESESEGSDGLWLALDQLQDPQNVGSVFRSAAFFGVRGVIMTQDRSAALTSAVYDVACGGIEEVPFAIIPNLQRAFEVSKDRGLWILGTSEHAKQSWDAVPRDRKWLLVLGNEEKGMRRLTAETCDMVCRIPPRGTGVTSLNVSVAAGVLISRLA
jgi:23S rRNA (guanosine2251-2'-O)-methyltransferase